MSTYADDILAPAAALNELTALWLAEAATFFEVMGETAVAALLREQVRAHRAQAIQLRALDGAQRQVAQIAGPPSTPSSPLS